MYGYIYINIIPGSNRSGYVGQHKYSKPELDPNYHGSSMNSDYYNDISIHGNPVELLLATADTSEELDKLECYWINECNSLVPNGYNINSGGGSGWSGLYNLKYSDPERYSKLMNKRSLSMIEKNKWIKKTIPPNQWTIDHDRMYNLVFTDETKAKISNSVKSLWMNPEYRIKQSIAHSKPRYDLRGRTFSEKARLNMSNAHKGKKSPHIGNHNKRLRYYYELPDGTIVTRSQPRKVKNQHPDWKYIGPIDPRINE